MLGDLQVKNFAIIDKLSLSFSQGLNILTGETGAGKSIIIGALEMLFGSRASREVIKDGKEAAYIEASYFLSQSGDIDKILQQAGIESDPESLILAREIRRSGRNRCRVNGQLVPLKLIREIAGYLVDIHGQHEYQNLLKSSYHLDILDELLPEEGRELLTRMEAGYAKLEKLQQQKAELEKKKGERARRLDIIDYQLKEISEADPQPGELEELTRELKKLDNLEEISAAAGRASDLINGDDYNENSLLNQLGRIKDDLQSVADYDEDLKEMTKLADEIFSSLQDLGFRLRSYYENQDFDQSRAEQLRQRLDLINNLRRKYGECIAEILSYQQEIRQEKEELEGLEDRLAKVEADYQKTLKECQEIADRLTEYRKETARWLENKLIQELKELAMSEARFQVDFSEEKKLTSRGQDRVEFLFSTNPGMELKKLRRIASGGEVSRIMLAFKTIIAGFDRVQTLIFDEVDSGVGGETALQMANRLFKISIQRQVLCITHLPQIASMADRHFYIEKIIPGENEVQTRITRLSEEERKQEIARMVGGDNKTAAGLKHADEMLSRAEKIKLKM